jgi:hypothetical protein
LPVVGDFYETKSIYTNITAVVGRTADCRFEVKSLEKQLIRFLFLKATQVFIYAGK